MIGISDLAFELGVSEDTIYNLCSSAPDMIIEEKYSWLTVDNADLLRQHVAEYREQWTEIVWTEDSPTYDTQNGNRWGQHGMCEGVPVLRFTWTDGSPATRWWRCFDCDPKTGLAYT